MPLVLHHPALPLVDDGRGTFELDPAPFSLPLILICFRGGSGLRTCLSIPYHPQVAKAGASKVPFFAWLIVSFVLYLGMMWAFPYGYRFAVQWAFYIGGLGILLLLSVQAFQRTMIMDLAQIETGCFEACMAHLFCPCCAIAQEAQIIENAPASRLARQQNAAVP